MKKRQSVRISAKVLILNAPPMGDVHTKNQLPVSKNGLVRAGLRLKSVKNAVFRPFLKKCRKGDVIRSQRNLGLPGFKCRRRFSEILGPFGWITASHGFGSPQKVQFFTVFVLFLTQNSLFLRGLFLAAGEAPLKLL